MKGASLPHPQLNSFDLFHSDTKESRNNLLDKYSPVFVPRHLDTQIPREEDDSIPVIVDTNKKDKMKYLYQGGYTTVVTGGVMLGSGASTANKKANGPKKHTPALWRNKPTSLPVPVNKRVQPFHSWMSPPTSRV
jgi:hypothetical protein